MVYKIDYIPKSFEWSPVVPVVVSVLCPLLLFLERSTVAASLQAMTRIMDKESDAQFYIIYFSLKQICFRESNKLHPVLWLLPNSFLKPTSCYWSGPLPSLILLVEKINWTSLSTGSMSDHETLHYQELSRHFGLNPLFHYNSGDKSWWCGCSSGRLYGGLNPVLN